MFGIYSNQRLTERERKILYEHPDDYNWYMVVLSQIFNDPRFFQVREDIKLPQSEDDDGVVLIFDDGEVVYFKTIGGEVRKRDVESIIEVCSFLEDQFNQPIVAYVVCPTEFWDVDIESMDCYCKFKIVFSAIKSDDGEEIIEKLEEKLDSNQKFTFEDTVDHILLPFTGYNDKDVFEKKFKHYMNKVNANGG